MTPQVEQLEARDCPSAADYPVISPPQFNLCDAAANLANYPTPPEGKVVVTIQDVINNVPESGNFYPWMPTPTHPIWDPVLAAEPFPLANVIGNMDPNGPTFVDNYYIFATVEHGVGYWQPSTYDESGNLVDSADPLPFDAQAQAEAVAWLGWRAPLVAEQPAADALVVSILQEQEPV